MAHEKRGTSIATHQEFRFFCTRCNRCCRHDEGYVFLSEADLSRLSVGLGLSRDEVIGRYCRPVDSVGFKRLSLGEQANLDCVFWNGGCTVYNHRPLQCRSYPFWPAYVSDKAQWDLEGSSCPGINIGPVAKADDIEEWSRSRQREPLISLDS